MFAGPGANRAEMWCEWAIGWRAGRNPDTFGPMIKLTLILGFAAWSLIVPRIRGTGERTDW